MKDTNNQRFLKLLIKILKTIGACAFAYMILAILSNYGAKKPMPASEINNDAAKDNEEDEIIEAKIETWR